MRRATKIAVLAISDSLMSIAVLRRAQTEEPILFSDTNALPMVVIGLIVSLLGTFAILAFFQHFFRVARWVINQTDQSNSTVKKCINWIAE
jgi:hypothetical protein